MEKIENYEFQSFKPNSKTSANLNEPNRKIEFEIDVGDGLIHLHNADCHADFDVIGRDADGTLTEPFDRRLIDNFFPHLFSEVVVKTYGQTIDVIENPGLTSTAIATCLYSKPASGDVLAGGFEIANLHLAMYLREISRLQKK
jgi:hypothetical protein